MGYARWHCFYKGNIDKCHLCVNGQALLSRDRRQYSAKKTLTVPSKLTFGNLTAQKKFNDVTLVCEDHKLEKAHKVILARK